MEATEQEDHIADAGQFVAPPNGGVNELLDMGEDNMQGQVRKPKQLLFSSAEKILYLLWFFFATCTARLTLCSLAVEVLKTL